MKKRKREWPGRLYRTETDDEVVITNSDDSYITRRFKHVILREDIKRWLDAAELESFPGGVHKK